MRVCFNCKIKKTLESFHRDKWDRQGRSRLCKQCSSVYSKINKDKRYKKRQDLRRQEKDKIETRQMLGLLIKKKERGL